MADEPASITAIKGTAKTQVASKIDQNYDGFLSPEASQQLSALVGQFTPRAIILELARQLELNANSTIEEKGADSSESQTAYRALAQAERIRNASARI